MQKNKRRVTRTKQKIELKHILSAGAGITLLTGAIFVAGGFQPLKPPERPDAGFGSDAGNDAEPEEISCTATIITAPPSWECGPPTIALFYGDVSASLSPGVCEKSFRDQGDTVNKLAFQTNNLVVKTRKFGAGSLATEPAILPCIKPPERPRTAGPCTSERFNPDNAIRGTGVQGLLRGDGYQECAKKYRESLKEVNAYHDLLRHKEEEMKQERAKFMNNYKEGVISLSEQRSSEISKLTFLLEIFASIPLDCKELRQKEFMKDGGVCRAYIYSDFEPSPRPPDFEERLKGISLKGIKVHVVLIPHVARSDELDKKLNEVRGWFSLMGVEPEIRIFSYDLPRPKSAKSHKHGVRRNRIKRT